MKKVKKIVLGYMSAVLMATFLFAASPVLGATTDLMDEDDPVNVSAQLNLENDDYDDDDDYNGYDTDYNATYGATDTSNVGFYGQQQMPMTFRFKGVARISPASYHYRGHNCGYSSGVSRYGACGHFKHFRHSTVRTFIQPRCFPLIRTNPCCPNYAF